ncbi:hypothetical protein SASPL_143833 [Salvia splendens]|uniref:Rhamnogalacturonan lyase domain-containing protein n=1 Tax=Salvia splendens TaxID=180675 RepID=A0A8X8ZAP4_SALSN|nr:hypothetical protein SASPL_143833 [Salvia splendens]
MADLPQRDRWDFIIWRLALVGHLFFTFASSQDFDRPMTLEENIEAVLPSNGVLMVKHDQHGYQFWTEANENGNFLIKNVICGTYRLFASVPGTIGDYKHASDIIISPGSNVVVSDVVFDAPRNGPTAEFFIPDPSLA